MKSATKILSGLMVTALILPAAAGTASAATYHSDSDTSLGLLDYLENEHRAARAQKPNPEKEQLKADTEEMSKHLRYPIDPTKAAPVAFEGDDLTWNQVTGDFTAKGKVKVTQLDQHRFEGENVDGNTIDERIHIPGKGHMLQFTPGQTEVMLDGFETNYNYRTRTGTMESAKGKVAENYMTGKKFEFYPDKIVIYDGTKTKCSAINPDYSLFARKIEIYPNDKMVMHNVRFKIKGVTFLSKSQYEVNLKKDTTVSDWFPRFGYDKTNGLWVRQNLKQPIAKHVDANAKIGMLGNAGVVRAVADGLYTRRLPHLVLDPVMIAKSGDALLADDAIALLLEAIFPLATLITPNLPEAGVLLRERAPESVREMRRAAEKLRELLSHSDERWVLLKGGHLPGDDLVDLLFDGDKMYELPSRRIATRHTHGTGCSYSAAIAALLPQRGHVPSAVREAHAWLARAIARADELAVAGSPAGHGPVHHFHALWPPR